MLYGIEVRRVRRPIQCGNMVLDEEGFCGAGTMDRGVVMHIDIVPHSSNSDLIVVGDIVVVIVGIELEDEWKKALLHGIDVFLRADASLGVCNQISNNTASKTSPDHDGSTFGLERGFQAVWMILFTLSAEHPARLGIASNLHTALIRPDNLIPICFCPFHTGNSPLESLPHMLGREKRFGNSNVFFYANFIEASLNCAIGDDNWSNIGNITENCCTIGEGRTDEYP